MKKLFFFGALIAAGLSFTACSSDNDVAENNGSTENGGSNFISISINLPSEPVSTTRADDNGNQVTYDDGLAIEYTVHDAMVIIFDASTNNLKGAYTITPSWETSSDGNVTWKSKQIVTKVGSTVSINDLMLVVLNNNGLFEVQSDNSLKVMKNGTLTAFAGSYTDLIDQANGYLATTTGLNCGVMNTTGFFMANAPLAKYRGSGNTPTDGSVQVLVPITAVYTTEDNAKSGTPDQIYVERGMAKVTMTASSGNLTSAQVSATNDLAWTVSAWTLDNTNPASYLVRSTNNFSTASTGYWTLSSNATSAPSNRCIGNTAITEGSPSYPYRTYFAESANFSKTATSSTAAGDFSLKTFTLAGTDTNSDNIDDAFSTQFTSEHPQYCFENTFPVDEQNVSHTTLVQLAVITKYSSTAQNLYTIDGNKSTVFLEDAIKTKIAAAASAFIEADQATKTYIESGTNVKSADFTVTSITRNESTGIVNGAVITYSGTGTDPVVLKSTAFESGSTLTAALCTSIVSTLTEEITQYKGGVSYYHIRIKHFGDVLTPWNNGETTAPSAGSVYPSGSNRNGNYLGRYGVLRNNWYDLSVSSIKRLGDAVPHTGNWPGTTDDEFDNYITFKINILSWAKRTQSAAL